MFKKKDKRFYRYFIQSADDMAKICQRGSLKIFCEEQMTYVA